MEANQVLTLLSNIHTPLREQKVYILAKEVVEVVCIILMQRPGDLF
jgi:hypothetical protein